MTEGETYSLSDGAIEDINWFTRFLTRFNGVAVIRSQSVFTAILLVDACLTGGGALWQNTAHVLFKWPASCLQWNLSINHLELFNLLIAIRHWHKNLQGQTVLIKCDNNTSVLSLLKGHTNNTFMAVCLRELWHICCVNDIFIECQHIKGSDNCSADVLSRAFISPKDWMNYEMFENSCKSVRQDFGKDLFRYPDEEIFWIKETLF